MSLSNDKAVLFGWELLMAFLSTSPAMNVSHHKNKDWKLVRLENVIVCIYGICRENIIIITS